MRYPITFSKINIILHSKIVIVVFDIVHCVKVKKKLQKNLFIMIYQNITLCIFTQHLVLFPAYFYVAC